MRYVILDQVQFEGETKEDMERRIRLQQEHNRRIDERQRRTPIRAMVEWARERGIV